MFFRIVPKVSLFHAACIGIAAVIAAALPLLISIVAYSHALQNSSEVYSAQAVIDYSTRLLQISAGHVVLLGIPAVLWLHSRNQLIWIELFTIGYLIGGLAAVFWIVVGLIDSGFAKFDLQAAMFRVGFWAPQGALTGLTFWGTWRLLVRHPT